MNAKVPHLLGLCLAATFMSFATDRPGTAQTNSTIPDDAAFHVLGTVPRAKEMGFSRDQTILNGLEWRPSQGIPDRGPVKSGTLAVSANAKRTTAFYYPGAAVGGAGLLINVALLGFDLVTDVKRGENGGRTLKHDFVVLGFQSREMAVDGKGVCSAGPIDLKSSTDDVPGAVVVWVSRADGEILQVAGGWLAASKPGAKN